VLTDVVLKSIFMKKLENFKGKKILIQFNSFEEWERRKEINPNDKCKRMSWFNDIYREKIGEIKPIFYNPFYSVRQESNFTFSVDGYITYINHGMIDCYRYEKESEIIQASDFLINNK